jgi:chlorinating enzyme
VIARTALSAESRARYRRDGILFPVRVFEPDEIARMSERLDALRRATSGALPPMLIVKPHLLVPWLWDLVHDSRILDLVESLLGPNLLCWNSNFFDKAAASPQRICWHQDATYWALSRPDALTVWIALSPSTIESGCLRVVPASHVRQLPHEHCSDPDDMLIGRDSCRSRSMSPVQSTSSCNRVRSRSTIR